MANIVNSQVLGPYVLRAQSDGLFNPNEIAQKIENMYLLEEGTMRSIWGPTAYVPLKEFSIITRPGGTSVGDRPFSRLTSVTTGTTATPVGDALDHTEPYYGFKQHGIFHTILPNGRDVLLLHTGNEVWEFRGWYRNWRQLLSTPASLHGLNDDLLDSAQPMPPTQFVSTGNGIVIVPQGGRAYFYDGAYIAPLGFNARPAAPLGRGPQSSAEQLGDAYDGLNDRGYAHSSARAAAMLDNNTNDGWKTGTDDEFSDGTHAPMTRGFGDCRIGTIATIPINDPESLKTGTSGWLEQGSWQCAVQYVDKWGNLSALSAPSNPVTCDLHPAVLLKRGGNDPSKPKKEWDGKWPSRNAPPQKVRIQLKWEGIPRGPEHVVGRRLYRTKDVENTGDSTYYYLTQNALATSQGFATLPDNVVTMYPDNIPDGWLTEPAQRVMPVPQFQLCTMALGRLWIANIDGLPGTARPSEPGFWGTFVEGNDISPDPMSEITGLGAVTGGLLICTTGSTFLIEASDDGKGFKYRPISASVGCAAPSSMVATSQGVVVWLGFDGFYSFDGQQVQYLSAPLKRTLKRLTLSRLIQAVGAYDRKSREYRCWVSLDGDPKNSTCFVLDKDGWRTRTDMVADSVCLTQDHRQYMLLGGHITNDPGRSGVYLLDHDASPDIPAVVADRESLIETAWLEADTADKAKTSYVVYLWLRETENTTVTIEVLRNWRNEVIEANTAKRYSEKDVPDFWATTRLGSGTWRDKRPFWTRAAIHVPSAEAVKFRLRGTGNWEFVGFQVELASRYYGGAQVTP